MNTTFFIIWAGILAFDGVLNVVLSRAAESSRFSKYRIRTPKPHQRLDPRRKMINTGLNNIFALLIFIAFFYFLGSSMLYAGTPAITTLLGEVLGTLLLYDLMYYFFHRAMHHPKGMKWVHGVHHFVRFPTANESIYLHPGETLGGLGLLLLAVCILGPISTTGFLLVFLLHSSINLIVHSNLVIPHPAFRLFNFWTRGHDVHHTRIRYNYASIFPFWDMAFGTYK